MRPVTALRATALVATLALALPRATVADPRWWWNDSLIQPEEASEIDLDVTHGVFVGDLPAVFVASGASRASSPG